MSTIITQRQPYASLQIGRSDGTTWTELSPYLAYAEIELGDVSSVGTGTSGVDGVVRRMRFRLRNDRVMLPHWSANLEVPANKEIDTSLEIPANAPGYAWWDILLGPHKLLGDSFSPRDRNSAWNKWNDDYDPLLKSQREVILRVATPALGAQPSPEDFVTLIHGVLGREISTDGPQVTCACEDLARRLQRKYIRTVREYGSPTGTPAETVIQQILDDNTGQGTVELYCPVSPGFMITPYEVEYQSVWDAIQQVAAQIGWFLGYRWDENIQEFRLTFMEPPRNKDASTADFILDYKTDYYRKELTISDDSVRNLVDLTYRNKETGERVTITVLDQDSIDEYGELAMGVEEADTSLIDTPEEAQAWGEVMIHDLKDQAARVSIDMPLCPQMDVFSGIVINDPRISSTQDFYGVESVKHTLDWGSNKFRTTVIASGKVIGGRKKWLRMQTRPGAPGQPARIEHQSTQKTMPAPTGVAVSSIPGGIAVKFDDPKMLRWKETEIYISEEQGFAPDSTTFYDKGCKTIFECISDLEPGTTYYVRVCHRDNIGNRSAYSDELSAQAGFIPQDQLDPTPPSAPALSNPVVSAVDLGSGEYDVTVSINFVLPDNAVNIRLMRRKKGSGPWIPWTEVGAPSLSPYADRGGLEMGETYEYRAKSVNALGKQSAAYSNTVEAEVDLSDVLPPNVTGLTGIWQGCDLLVSWDPVPGATGYRVRFYDPSGSYIVGGATTGDTQYRYTYEINRVNYGSSGSNIVRVRVEARNKYGNYSPLPTEGVYTKPAPAVPTISVRSSLTQIRWEITGNLDSGWDQVSVQVGTYSQTAKRTSGVIDLADTGFSDGAEVEVRVKVKDRFSTESSWATSNVTGHYLTQRDLAGELFEVVYESEQFPSGADPSVLYDNDTSTGITFAQAPTILIRHPKEERFGMIELFVSDTVQGYVQLKRANSDQWVSVIGTPSEPYEFMAGENAVAFTGMRMLVAQEVKVVLLSPVAVYECVPSTIVMAHRVLAGTMQLTDELSIESEDGRSTLTKLGLSVRDIQGLRARVGDLTGLLWDGEPLPANTFGAWLENAFISGMLAADMVKTKNIETGALTEGEVLQIYDENGIVTETINWATIPGFNIEFTLEVPSIVYVYSSMDALVSDSNNQNRAEIRANYRWQLGSGSPRTFSEIIGSIRTLAWAGNNVTRAIAGTVAFQIQLALEPGNYEIRAQHKVPIYGSYSVASGVGHRILGAIIHKKAGVI